MKQGRARTTVLTSLSCLLLLSSIFATPAAAASSEEGVPETCRDSISHIPVAENESGDVTVEFTSRPNGTVVANYTVNRRDIRHGFRLSIPEEYEILDSDGFSRGSNGDFNWDRETEEPSIVYQVDILNWIYEGRDMPSNVSRYHSDESNYTISYVPNHGGATFDVKFPEDGEMGSSIMYIGRVDRVETVERGCHTVRFVVPEGVDDESVNEAKAPIANATTGLGIGGHYDETTLFVQRTHVSGFVWGSDGVFGANWVNQTTGTHVPLHEYIHTRQARELGENMTWMQEGGSTYLTARFLLDEGMITTGEYDYLLTDIQGWSGEGDLREKSSWGVRYDYAQGTMFLGHLDRDLRNQTNATMFDVVNSTNSGDSPLTYKEFERELQNHGLELEDGLYSKQVEVRGSGPPYIQDPLWMDEVVFGMQSDFGSSFLAAHVLSLLIPGLALFGIGYSLKTGIGYVLSVVR